MLGTSVSREEHTLTMTYRNIFSATSQDFSYPESKLTETRCEAELSVEQRHNPNLVDTWDELFGEENSGAEWVLGALWRSPK